MSQRLSRRAFLGGGLATAGWWLGRRRLPTANFVYNLWSGALTATSARVKTRIAFDSPAVRVWASPTPDFSQPVFSTMGAADVALNDRMVGLDLTGLQPDTIYYLAVEADGALDLANTGRLRTPGEGPYSFTFAFASCADTGTDHPVFTTMRGHQPLFFLHLGDMHYRSIDTNEIERYRLAYRAVLASATQKPFFRETPLAYVWDDHDYGPNNSDKTAPGREAARLTYQEYVPHHPLVAGGGDVPIYQAFTIGRARFILTDLRSESDVRTLPFDDTDKSMLGATQKAWFKQELLAANGVYPLIFWACSVPWRANWNDVDSDSWNGFRAERRELADFIRDHDIRGLLMLSGDIHMMAIDNGDNNRYGTGAPPAFPVMQAAPLDKQPTFFPGMPWSVGYVAERGQFGLVTVEDDGGEAIRVRWSGRNADDAELLALEMTVLPAPTLAVAPGSLHFTAAPAGITPPIPLEIANGSADVVGWTTTVDPPAPWLDVTPVTGWARDTSPGAATVSVDPLGLSPGRYETTVRFAAPGATGSPQDVPVVLRVTDGDTAWLPLVRR